MKLIPEFDIFQNFERIYTVKLTVQIKLLPNQKQEKLLLETLETSNRAANRLSQLAWDAKETRQFPMHKAHYRKIRSEFPLSAQIVVRLIAKVADAYKVDHKKVRVFRKHGSISYDNRILSFKIPESEVSIWTIGGRETIGFACGVAQRKLLELPRGESNLIFSMGKWFLSVSIEIPEEKEIEATEWLGVDMGIVEIAPTSDGQIFSGKHLNAIRSRNNRLRRNLQKKETRSARRLIKKRGGKESRFSEHTNHCISKQIVSIAKRTGRGIALEDLKGIRDRIRAGRKQMRALHSWAFSDLQFKIGYKAKRAGVPVRLVDPRNTSRTCPACGHISKKNRPNRESFICAACGHTGNADTIAAGNISSRAAVIQPNESRIQS